MWRNARVALGIKRNEIRVENVWKTKSGAVSLLWKYFEFLSFKRRWVMGEIASVLSAVGIALRFFST